MRTLALEPELLPLIIGGPEDGVHAPGIDREHPVAYIGIDDGALFVQPDEQSPQPLLCNGVAVSASRWLHHGDLLTVGHTRLEVVSDGERTELRVSDAPNAAGAVALDVAAAPTAPATQGSGLTVSPADYVPRSQRPTRRRGPYLRPVAVLVWLTVLAAVPILWFALTARSVRLEVTPEPESMTLRGGLVSPRMGGRFLLRPGEYVVEAEKAGYRPLQTTVLVDGEPRQTISLAMELLPGHLFVSTGEISGAEVLVDGEWVGRTPLEGIELEPGTHHVAVRAPRHRELLTTVEIEGAGVARRLELALEAAFAPVTVRSEPAGASLILEGDRAGTTPLTVDLDAGTHDFELVLSGYRPHRGRLLVKAGEPQTPEPIRLTPWDGNLVVMSQPTGASVVVDGVFRGTTPVDVRLHPGRAHELQLTLAGYQVWTRTVRLGSGERSEVNAVLSAVLGQIEVDCQPADAELLVNGVHSGRARQVLELPAVPHQIVVQKEGFEPYEITVTPQSEFTQRLDVTLQPLGERARPAPEAVVETSHGVPMRLIPPGRFTMGASRREPGRRANETLRQVEITRPFYLAEREVSNREFRRFHEAHLSGAAGGSNLEIDHHPVVRVTWEQAARYCNWLSAKESLPEVYESRGGRMVARTPFPAGYRLPTEAEWTWAARFDPSGASRKYAWGNALPIPQGAGNYADSSARRLLGDALPDYTDGHAATAPVGSFKANARGVYNMGGNVSEWVHDIYSIQLASPGEVERDPAGPAEGEYHVIRGASWMDDSVTELRLSYRDYGNQARPDVGFRIARSVE